MAAERSPIHFLLARYQTWNQNPVCHRVNRALKRPAQLLILYHFLSGLIFYALFIFVAGGSPRFAMVLQYLGTGLALALAVAVPIWYSRWVYRRLYLGDEQLRLTALSGDDYLSGFLLPLARLQIFLLGASLAVMALGNSLFFMTTPASPFLLLNVFFFSFITRIGFFLSVTIFSISVALRVLVQEAMHAQGSHQSYRGLVLLISVFTVLYLLASWAPGLILALTFILGLLPPTPWLPSVLSMVLHLIADLIALVIICLASTRLWRGDYQFASLKAFSATE